jgi:hypothetical protein
MSEKWTRITVGDSSRPFWFGIAWRAAIGVFTGRSHKVEFLSGCVSHDWNADIEDDQIIAVMRKHLDERDGGYVCDTAGEAVVAAGRALLAVSYARDNQGE